MDLNGLNVGLAIIFTCLCAPVSAVHCCAGNNRSTSLFGVQIHECTRQEADSGIHVHLSCPSKHVLVDILISVGRSEHKCVGKTLDLIVSVNKCYWQQSCSVSLPRTRIVSCKSSTEQNTMKNCPCIGNVPDMIRVDRAKCAPTKYVQDLTCEKRDRRRKNNHKSKRRKHNDISRKVGIIRSHPGYPWDYKGVNETTVCSFKINHKKKAVVFETVVADICEFDDLSVSHYSDNVENIKQEIIDNIKIVINDTKNRKVKFSFKRRSDKDGCGGFIICYKVTDPIRRQDVCDELMVMDATLKITSGIYSGPPQRKEYTEYCTDHVTDSCCGETSCGGSKCDW